MMEEEILFQPGDPIVPMARPFAKTLNVSHKGRFCDYCFKPGRLNRCGGCRKMHYCGKSCQKRDWKEGHSVECKSLVFNGPSCAAEESVFTLLGAGVDRNLLPRLLRTLAKFQLSPEAFTEKHLVYGELQRSFDDMLGHEDTQNTPTTAFLSLLFKELEGDPPFGKVGFGEDFLRKLLGVWNTNSFALSNEDESETIGAGLFIAHSVFNHACRPNAVRVGVLDRMEVRCIHPIPKGAEPVISYLAGNRDLERRQAVLKTRYNFTCACDLCTLETSSGLPLIDYGKLESLNAKLRSCHESRYQSIIDIRERALTLFLKLYHEFDERTTNFCSMAFDVLLQFNQMCGGGAVPKLVLRKEAGQMEKRLRITFGEDSVDYRKFVREVKGAGIQIGAGGKK